MGVHLRGLGTLPNKFLHWWWQWISRLWWWLGCKLLWSNPDPNVNSASEFEAGSWVPQVVVPQLWMKRISKCTCMHLYWHIHDVMVPIVNPFESCMPLHHWVFTINIGINSNFSNFYPSNNSSFWVSRVIPRVQRILVFSGKRPPIPDASRRPATTVRLPSLGGAANHSE